MNDTTIAQPATKLFRILEYPRDGMLLRRKARPVRPEEFKDPSFLEFMARLAVTMREAGGAGLASTQVAESGPNPPAAFAFCVDAGWDLGLRQVDVVCNPVIVASSSDMRSEPEGCLSFSSVAEPMRAPAWLVLDCFNADGQAFRSVLNGMAARVAFHETRHLAGALMIDLMSPFKRKLFLKRVTDVRRDARVQRLADAMVRRTSS